MTQAVIAAGPDEEKGTKELFVQFVTGGPVGHARIRLDTEVKDVAVCDECAVCRMFLAAGQLYPVLR
jgi:hypothetical protein